MTQELLFCAAPSTVASRVSRIAHMARSGLLRIAADESAMTAGGSAYALAGLGVLGSDSESGGCP